MRGFIMANLLEKTRKITSILKRTDEQLQVEMSL